MPDEFDYSATITNLDIRENLPAVDPENLSSADVLQILLYLFQRKPGFIDRGHELNNVLAPVERRLVKLVER